MCLRINLLGGQFIRQDEEHLSVIRAIYINAHYAQFFEYQIMAKLWGSEVSTKGRRQTLNFYDIISWATRQNPAKEPRPTNP